MDRYGMQRIYQKRSGVDLIQCYKNTEQSRGIRKDCTTESAVKDFFAAQEEKENRVHDAIEQLKESQREVVIWGIGSYVMNLMATTELGKCNLQGFVDNNKIKHGREMYGHTIYSPDFLKDKSDMVLI
jgi:hypothetical protein